ncbi:MAG: putative membrane channel-forming protein YqfA (hemolysin III family) [Vicingaceae bacterium]|jgi:predicted membrane channel-forming protein YqfA (hemolysin III family)
MLDKIYINIKGKSLKQRFLLVIGILFLILYFVLGLFVIFMKHFPINMSMPYRVAFGILLVVYAIIRFTRIINDAKT